MREYVDCSSHNGVPDLQAYWDAGHRDLMLKATEGTAYAWERMPDLSRQWHALGGRCGYYHWLYGTTSGAAQFAWFWIKIASVFQPGDWLMTDFEDVDPIRWRPDAEHLAVLKDFNARCATKAEHCTYTGNWYLDRMPLCADYLRRLQRVVMSDYTNDPPRNPHGLDICAHQFTDRATVPGFAGPVDYNRWLTSNQGTPASPVIAQPHQEEIEMMIIHPEGRPALPALSNGVAATRLRDGVTVAALRKAGVPVVAFSERDYAAQIKAGQK